MFIDFLLERFDSYGHADAIVWNDRTFDYAWLGRRVREWVARLHDEGIDDTCNVALQADFSPASAALFLAIVECGGVVVPLADTLSVARREEFERLAECARRISLSPNDEARFESLPYAAEHPLFAELRRRKHPGLVLFTSGSTGKAKGIPHDMMCWLDKFRTRRKALRTMTFLLYDHVGGVNTMLQTLANGGCVITERARTPDAVLAAVARHRVEVLPTTPTFVNLVLLSGAHERHDLSSLHTLAYGAEPMPASVLARFHELFPHVRLHQNFGMSEVGVLNTKSERADSLWVRLGGEGYETRVVDGVLQIKAHSTMLGYLNAPSPFTEDGWFVTGDLVEQKGEYVRFLGRKSEIINVGGEKVFPAEVENALQQIDNVREATVYGEKNPIMGQIVCARVAMLEPEDEREFTHRLRQRCADVLQRYQIPVKIEVTRACQHTDRFKKERVRT